MDVGFNFVLGVVWVGNPSAFDIWGNGNFYFQHHDISISLKDVFFCFTSFVYSQNCFRQHQYKKIIAIVH